MEARRVFVIWTHPLFHEAVRLLLNHPEVEWVGSNSDYETARSEVLKLQPDTVLVEEAGQPTSDKMMKLLEGSTWKLRVVGLSLDTNNLTVYHHEQRSLAQTEDLLHLILSELRYFNKDG